MSGEKDGARPEMPSREEVTRMVATALVAESDPEIDDVYDLAAMVARLAPAYLAAVDEAERLSAELRRAR